MLKISNKKHGRLRKSQTGSKRKALSDDDFFSGLAEVKGRLGLTEFQLRKLIQRGRL